jgi:hypothetical protein
MLSFSMLTKQVQATTVTTFNADKPRVLLDGFSVSEDVVVPGEDFELTFTLRNPSTSYSVYSILLTFTNDYVVPIYGQDDQIYIDTIPAGGTKDVTVSLEAADKITTTSIKFEIYVTYSDDEHSNNNNLITIQLPITKTSKFEIQNVSFPEHVYVGNKTRVHVNYKNTGVDDFYNIMINIVGEGFEESHQQNLGSLVAGNESYTEAYVDFIQSGDQTAQISFSYEDIEGNRYTTEAYEMSFTALEEEAPESTEVIAIGGQNSASNDFTLQIVLYSSITLMSVVVILLILNYKKR